MVANKKDNKGTPSKGKGAKGKQKGERSGSAKPPAPRKGQGQDAGSAGKPCPKQGQHNDVSWYTKEGVPIIGANFASLQDVSPDTATGLVTETIIHYDVALIPPVDQKDSFWQKMNDLYTEIRESNSGAANYNTAFLAAYALNIVAAHGLFWDAAKKCASISETDVNAARSAYVRAVACGVYSYRAFSEDYANRVNDLVLLAKELETLPVVNFSAMERFKYFFGGIFKDSDSMKPTYINFHPDRVVWFKVEIVDGVTQITPQIVTFPHNSDDYCWKTVLSTIQDIISYINSNPLMTILRGDLRNAFGSAAMQEGVLMRAIAEANSPRVLDADLMSKLENASFTGLYSGANSSDFTVDFNPSSGKIKVTVPCSGANDPDVMVRGTQPAVLINWHKSEAPTSAELAGITRTMSLVTEENHLTRSWFNVDACDGMLILDIKAVSTFNATSYSHVSLSTLMEGAQDGDADKMKSLAFYCSVCDHMPQFFTKEESATGDGRHYMWDIDNFAVLYRDQIHTLTSRVIRSLYDVHVPRGEHGRRDKSA